MEASSGIAAEVEKFLHASFAEQQKATPSAPVSLDTPEEIKLDDDTTNLDDDSTNLDDDTTNLDGDEDDDDWNDEDDDDWNDEDDDDWDDEDDADEA